MFLSLPNPQGDRENEFQHEKRSTIVKTLFSFMVLSKSKSRSYALSSCAGWRVERSNHSFPCAFSVSPPEETEECIAL